MSGELGACVGGVAVACQWLAGGLPLGPQSTCLVTAVSDANSPFAAHGLAHTSSCLAPCLPHSYDWSQLTTVAWNEDPALLCAAHAAGARVVLDGHFDPHAVLGSAAARTAWVAAQLRKAQELHLDGINFDLVSSWQLRYQSVRKPAGCCLVPLAVCK